MILLNYLSLPCCYTAELTSSYAPVYDKRVPSYLQGTPPWLLFYFIYFDRHSPSQRDLNPEYPGHSARPICLREKEAFFGTGNTELNDTEQGRVEEEVRSVVPDFCFHPYVFACKDNSVKREQASFLDVDVLLSISTAPICTIIFLLWSSLGNLGGEDHTQSSFQVHVGGKKNVLDLH